MGGIAKGFSSAEAAVRALEAGADTLLMPTDPEAAIRAVVAAVESGRLSRQRIRQSVVKLLAAKERVGLDRNRLVDLEGLSDVMDSPEGEPARSGNRRPRRDPGAQSATPGAAGRSADAPVTW